MADIVTSDVRSRMMAGIKGKNTKPELLVRRALHAMGFRFRLHVRNLPGKPDLVFARYGAAVFVNGCFWHGHDCNLFKWPATRHEFWRTKILGNRENDARNWRKLHDLGWRTAVIWECALRGRQKIPFDTLMETCAGWLISGLPSIEFRGAEA